MDDAMKSSAKLKVLKHLKDMASGMMGDDVKGGMEGLKKVTVAAPDTQGLKHGLDKAKEVVGQMGDFDHSNPAGGDHQDLDHSMGQEGMEHPDMDHDEEMEDEMTPEEIDE